MEISGAQILMEILAEQGVDIVFGYPGGQVLIYMTRCMIILIELNI